MVKPDQVGTTDLSLFAGEFLKGEALAFGSPSTLPISTQDNRVIAGIVDDPEQSAQLVLSEINDAVRAPSARFVGFGSWLIS